MRTFLSLIALFFLASASFAAQPLQSERVSRRWTIVGRTVVQDQGDWQVEYSLRHSATCAVVLQPHDMAIAMSGWVSNSRVAVHGLPRPVRAEANASSGCNILHDVIASHNDLLRCRERMTVRLWHGSTLDPPQPIEPHIPPISFSWWTKRESFAMLSIPANELLRIRMRFGHEHFLFGPYNPLLGKRDIRIRLGVDVVEDTLPLDREQYIAHAREGWKPVPEDRRDTTYFISKPDSLHLEAHVPGNQSYRFAEKPVRYSTKMRLSFWYLIAPATEGNFCMLLTQYRDAPTGWQVLHAGMIEQMYFSNDRTYKSFDRKKNIVGRWVRVERVFCTEAEATSIALTFRISGDTDIGEVWIDDISLEPVGAPSRSP